MEKFIEVHDNVLDSKLVNLIEDITLTNSIIPFKYCENLTYENSNPKYKFKPGIVHTFINKGENTTNFNLPFLFNNILYNFCLSQNIILDRIYNGRVFIDLPTPHPKLDWPPHTDQNFPHWVCLYYINDSDGDTIFFGEDKKEIKRVSPKKGRIAFFDGSIYHAGTPSETKSRAVVNFNFTPYL